MSSTFPACTSCSVEKAARYHDVALEPVLRIEDSDVELLDRKSSSRCANISNTSRGHRTGAPSCRSSTAMRRPSSSAAWIPTARAVPTPLTLVRAATGCAARSRSDPRQLERMSWPIPSADRPSEPLPSSIAISSLELRACAPCVRRRSLGRSAVGSSRIVSGTVWLRIDGAGGSSCTLGKPAPAKTVRHRVCAAFGKRVTGDGRREAGSGLRYPLPVVSYPLPVTRYPCCGIVRVPPRDTS